MWNTGNDADSITPWAKCGVPTLRNVRMMRRGVRTSEIVRVCAFGKVFCVQYQIAVFKNWRCKKTSAACAVWVFSPFGCPLTVDVGDVDSDTGPKDTFDESAQVLSPFEDDINRGLDDGRVVGRIWVHLEWVESEVVLIW